VTFNGSFRRSVRKERIYCTHYGWFVDVHSSPGAAAVWDGGRSGVCADAGFFRCLLPAPAAGLPNCGAPSPTCRALRATFTTRRAKRRALAAPCIFSCGTAPAALYFPAFTLPARRVCCRAAARPALLRALLTFSCRRHAHYGGLSIFDRGLTGALRCMTLLRTAFCWRGAAATRTRFRRYRALPAAAVCRLTCDGSSA
jgi:hypothetical protein